MVTEHIEIDDVLAAAIGGCNDPDCDFSYTLGFWNVYLGGFVRATPSAYFGLWNDAFGAHVRDHGFDYDGAAFRDLCCGFACRVFFRGFYSSYVSCGIYILDIRHQVKSRQIYRITFLFRDRVL